MASTSENDGMFTSTTDLEHLLSTEAEVVNALQDYIRQEEDRLSKLRLHMLTYEAIREAAEMDVEKYVGNPLNSYLLIKKMTSDWKQVKELLSANQGLVFLTNLTSEEAPLRWPSEEDLNGAAVALTRLQDTYKLATKDLAEGNLNGVAYGPKLTAHDCFELGRQSYNNGDHYHTILWMKEALNKRSHGDVSVETADILEYIAFSWYSQGNLKKALQYTNELLAINPEHPRAVGNKIYYEDQLGSSSNNIKHRKGDDGEPAFQWDEDSEFTVQEQLVPDQQSDEHENYKRLCRGETLLSEKVRSRLKCRYYSGHHPFLKYAPYKEEEVALNPRLVIFYDVLPDEEIATVKALSTPRFKRATVQNYKTGDLETANYRISKTAWLKREEHKHIENIYRRVADVTGLNMETSEELQVSNYGIGGHYEPHFDFARREEINAFSSLGTGNRIATWLFYVSDVEQGGATVFPTLGISLWPKKGSAAFWHNLYQNGEGDVRTRHAACPVLAGTKWVSNFWIHERGQEFTRPCSTNPAK